MMFRIEFGLLGLIFISILLLSIPIFLGIIMQQRDQLLKIRNKHSSSDIAQGDDNTTPEQRGYQNFIRQLSHQTTNSLQAIVGAITNLEETIPLSSGESDAQLAYKQVEYVSQIRTETDRLLAQNKNLRLLAELESENAPISVKSVWLRPIVADVMMGQTDRASQLGLDLVYHGPDRPPRLLLNREQITQALLNLIDNSLKYRRPESKIIILSITPHAETVQIAVSDDGAGIPETHIPFLFESAYRAPDARNHTRGGNGLGLAIVKRIVERHNGQLQVDSTYGQGTTITITLPLNDPASISDRS